MSPYLNAFAWTDASNGSRPNIVNGLNQYTNVASVTTGYDVKGDLANSGATTFQYGAEFNLALLGTTSRFYYDPMNRLAFSTQAAVRYDYDGSDMVTEYNSTGNLVLRRYVFGPGTDEPLVRYEGSGTSDKRYLAADERGSIVSETNASGGAVAINTYDEYGVPGQRNSGRYQYTGQQWVPELGLYYYKARMYSPQHGRFMQPDRIGYADGPNWYNYVGSDPVNGTDPWGLTDTSAVETYPVYGCPSGKTFTFRTADGTVHCVGGEIPTLSGGLGGIKYPTGGAQTEPPEITVTAKPRKTNPPKKPDPCGGSVRAEGLNFTGILGLGITVSIGKVTVNGSGESSWFFSAGAGAGLDAGISGFATYYNSLSSFSGYGESYNGSVAVGRRSFGGSVSYNADGQRVGGSATGSGLPGLGLRAGASGTATDTTLLSGRCR